MTKNNNFFFKTVSLFIIVCFFSIFILSLFKIVNFWSFSQAHVNYFSGYSRRGLFGTFMLLLETLFGLEPKKTFSIFFILLTLINIFLFLILIKKYSISKMLFFFIALNPTLILFSFNDLGGFQRFDSISIFIMLFHSMLAFNYNSKKINLNTYEKYLYYFIFPLILISLFIHEIQAWSIPLHFFISCNIKKNNYLKLFFNYLIFLIPIVFIFFSSVDPGDYEIMIKSLKNRDLWFDAIEFSALNTKNFSVIEYEIKTNLLNNYNLTINIFFIIMATIPFYIMLIFLNNKNFLINNNLNNNLFFFSIFPYLTLFAIGDTGRWINMMSFTALSYLAQFPIKDEIKYFIYKIKIKYIFKIFIIFIVLIYIFFIRLPHCCNLQQKGITIWGGFTDKSIILLKILQKDENIINKFNQRFK